MKADLRWVQTEGKLKRATIQLLRKQPLAKLTVTALTQTAKVSRKAFYLHYPDMDSFVKAQENLIISQFKAVIETSHQTFKPKLNDPALVQQQSFTVLKQVLQIVNHHRNLIGVLLSDNGDPRFKHQLNALLNDEISLRIKLYQAHLTSRIPRRYAMEILVSGLSNLIVSWVNNPHPESVDHFAQILTTSRLIAPLDLLN